MNKKTNNIFKQIPKGWKSNDIGLIPEDWGLKKLSEASEIIMGQSPPSSTYNSVGSGLPFYQGKTDFGNVYPTPRIWCTSPSKISEKNDILISVRAPVGPTNLSFEKCGVGRGLSAIRARENYYLYLYYYLKKIEKEIEKLGTGSTFKAINKSQLYNIKIPLPSLPEQKKIAYVLSKIQQAIETQQQIIKTTQELKKALMQKLFTEGLNGEKQKLTEIGLIPESWELINLEDTGDVVYGIQASVAHLKKPIGLPILTNKNITLDGEIDLSELNYFELKTKRHFDTILKKGDILFNWRSGSKEHVGKTAFFDLDGEYVHSSFILRIRPKVGVNNKYVFYYLAYLRLSEYFIKLHSYSINAKFNKSAVNKLPTVLPSPAIQEKVAAYLTSIDMKIKLEQNKLFSLKNLFNTSLNNLMTGQIRVKDINLGSKL